MSDALEALADVRGWLCDNLNDKEAGKVCGMLSTVSREISRLEDENVKLRELLQRSITTHDKMCTQRKNCFGCRFFGDFVCEPIKVSKEAEKLGIEVE